MRCLRIHRALARVECQFIVIHPAYGLLLIEVKGGGIRYDGLTRQWWSLDREQVEHEIKDPAHQARNSMHALVTHLRRAPATEVFSRHYYLGYAVWFPDVEWARGGSNIPHLPDDLVLDVRDLAHPERGFLRVYEHFEQLEGQKHHYQLDEAALKALDEVLAPTLAVTSSLRLSLEVEDVQMTQLTTEQMRLLDKLNRARRVAIRGAAGTGKTVLAMEKAHRLAASGMDVLFVCSTSSLARWLQRKLKQETDEIRQHLFLFELRELCIELTKQAHLPFALVNHPSQPELVHQMNQCFRALKQQGRVIAFDAILVDEAQDIKNAMCNCLQNLLRDRANGLFYMFYDPAQNDISEGWTPPSFVAKETLVLPANYRNTQAIFRLAMQFYQGLDEPVCRGPEGREPWFIAPDTLASAASEEDREVVALDRVLHRLIVEEQIEPHDILVITGRGLERSRWSTRRSAGGYPLTWHSDGAKLGHVALSTIRSAKGLERKVVILVELDGLAHEPKRDALLYIAISRATHHLVVLGTPEQLVPAQRQPALWPAQAQRRAER